jgi:hypothetical protein
MSEQKSRFSLIKEFAMEYSGGQNQSDAVCLVNIVGKFESWISREQEKKKKGSKHGLFILDVDGLIAQYSRENHLHFHEMKDIHYSLNQVAEIL